MLVSAFAGRDAVLAAYRDAVEQRYRFFSYGDAMFIAAGVAGELPLRACSTRDAGTGARRGRLHTPHGTVETPVFMPVGTQATVKAVGQDDLQRARRGDPPRQHLPPDAPARERSWSAALGGLHRFMAWDRALLTDSGGFQVYSLAQNRKITEEGASFQSHLDGSKHLLTPERSVEIQEALGADIIMAFDECPPSKSERAYLEESLARTTRWLHRCAAAWSRGRERALRHRPGRAATSSSAAATWTRSARSTSRATRSAATRSASARRRCTPRWPRSRRCCPTTGPAT